MKPPSQAQLDAWLCEWQRVLRLQDWDVKVEIKRGHSMYQEDCEGVNRYQTALKRASIHVRHPLDYDQNDDFTPDPEATIIHELLHLHFAPWMAHKGLVSVLQEQVIEVLAQSFVALKRKDKTMAKTKGKGAKAAGSPPRTGKPPTKPPKGGKGKKTCG